MSLGLIVFNSHVYASEPSIKIKGLLSLVEMPPRNERVGSSVGREVVRVIVNPGIVPCKEVATFVVARPFKVSSASITETAPVNVAFF